MATKKNTALKAKSPRRAAKPATEPLLGEFTTLFGQWVECRAAGLKGTLPDAKLYAIVDRGSAIEHKLAVTPALGFNEIRRKIECYEISSRKAGRQNTSTLPSSTASIST